MKWETAAAVAGLLAVLGILCLVGGNDLEEARWAEQESRQWQTAKMRVAMEDF